MSQGYPDPVDHQAMYRTAFEQSLIGVAITTLDDKVLEVNSAMCEMVGFTREEVIAKGFNGMIHPEDMGRSESIMRRLVHGESQQVRVEMRFVSKSGRTVWALVHLRRVCENGEPCKILRQSLDITRRHDSERQLRESEARYRAASDGSLDSFCILQSVTNPQGEITDFQIIDANDRCCREIDKPREQVLGMQLVKDRPGSLPEAQLSNLIDVARTGKAIEHEAMVERSGSPTKWMRYQIVKAGDGVAISSRDVTERILGERALRQSEEHYRRMATSNSRLLSEVNHRVRNNLASLIAIISMMKRRPTTTAEFAADLTGKLRAMSQIHDMMASAGWQSVSLETLTRGLLASMNSLARQAAVVEVTGPQVNLATRQCVPWAMTFQELFANSSKYGAHASATNSGRINVTWSVEPRGETSHVTVRWVERGGPPITGEIKPSLGINLITGFVEHDLAGKVELRFPPEGADHTFEFDVKNITSEDRADEGRI